jgi:large subunit ribosomal protein L4
MKVDIINTKESLELSKEVWAIDYNADLVAQAVCVYRSNRRANTASTKTRADVSGGGIKPWKQKGTGRARHGSRRSPIWVKGGVTFGPNSENWSRKLNKKMAKKARNIVLSEKLKDNEILFVDLSKIGKDTKEIRKSLTKNIDKKNLSYLVITDNKDVQLAMRNMSNVSVLKLENADTYELLASKILVIDKNYIDKIEGKK